MPSDFRSQSVTSSIRPQLQIDAHHHLWRYNQDEFDWLTEQMATLRRNFLVPDLVSALDSAHIYSAIAVQARESVDETNFLIECADSTDRIAGVVGWAPLDDPNLPAILDQYSGATKLVGFREIAQGQPDGFFDRTSFNRGIAELTARDLTYDILIYQHQLSEAIRFVDRHPNQRFILDHAAKPRIAARDLEPWATFIRDLSRRPHVACKLSGMVTEADWIAWKIDSLRPYLDTCVEAFGTNRLLAGSDWPVCLVASSYSRWWNMLHEYFANFTADERNHVFGWNTIDVYRLSV